MVTAVSSIFKSLGENSSRKEVVGTPARFLGWLMNFQNCDAEMKPNNFIPSKLGTSKCNGEVKFNKQIHSELNLPFWSQCEHHLLPFHQVMHVGYFCDEKESRLIKSVLQSIVHFYGFKLQVHERLTRQIAETIAPLVVAIVSRGIENFGSSTATVAVLCRFAIDSRAKASFLDKYY